MSSPPSLTAERHGGEVPRQRAALEGLPGVGRKTANVVLRLAERADDAHDRDVTSALGAWRDGYITIRGTWCEVINAELLETLNARLADVNRQAALNREPR